MTKQEAMDALKKYRYAHSDIQKGAKGEIVQALKRVCVSEHLSQGELLEQVKGILLTGEVLFELVTFLKATSSVLKPSDNL